MEDPSLRPDPDHRSPPRAPRWVRVFSVIAAVVVLLLLILLLTGKRHGPGRHFDETRERVPAAEQRGPHP